MVGSVVNRGELNRVCDFNGHLTLEVLTLRNTDLKVDNIRVVRVVTNCVIRKIFVSDLFTHLLVREISKRLRPIF